MKNSHIRWVVFLGVMSVVGIIFTQVYWVQEAIENREEEFNHGVQMALRNVVESLCLINGNDISNDPIDQVSQNYFVARTNYRIDLESLDYLIKGEFEKRSISEDFEFGVYDCSTDRMVYGDFVSMTDNNESVLPSKLPILDDDEYYFGVYFPSKKAGMVNQMGFWKFTTAVTALLVLFFGYAMFVILRQKRLSEIQRDFINNMTHEFKTPLSTLKLSTDVLKKEVLSERGKKYIAIVASESERLQNHVSRLLSTYSQTAASKLEHIKVNKVCNDVFQTFHIDTEKTWSIDLDKSDPQVFGDPKIFEMIVFNLVDNAQKYGQSVMKLKTYVSGKFVHIDISNDGKVIAEKEYKKIFQKFYRISQGDLHDVKGFGLGLFIVKEGVRSMKGKVKVTSSTTETLFSVKLPLS